MAQTPGQIFRTAVNDSLLDPNGDCWISQTTSGFSDTPTIIDESEEFETAWNVLWHFEAEPSSDLQTGSTCGVPLMVHYYEDAVYSRASDGTFNVHAYGEELTAMTDSSGSLITLPAGDYFITGYTNHWGCYNPEPATSGTPTANPSYRLITVSHLLPD